MDRRVRVSWRTATARIVGALIVGLGLAYCILEFLMPKMRPNHGSGLIFCAGILLIGLGVLVVYFNPRGPDATSRTPNRTRFDP
jgi:hypothetical protein